MSEVVFEFHNIDTFQSFDSNVLNLFNRKIELHTANKESITVSNLKSVSLITEICKSGDSTCLIVSVINSVFALTPYLNSFYFFDPCIISCYIQQDVQRCP